jgi:hypothetical protein
MPKLFGVSGTPVDDAGGRLESAMWILLLVPFVGLLWVPFYNFTEPSLRLSLFLLVPARMGADQLGLDLAGLSQPHA